MIKEFADMAERSKQTNLEGKEVRSIKIISLEILSTVIYLSSRFFEGDSLHMWIFSNLI